MQFELLNYYRRCTPTSYRDKLPKSEWLVIEELLASQKKSRKFFNLLEK